jgi:hypothetical protein
MIPTIGRWADAPDLIEPIVGYRAWRYTMSDRGVHVLPFNLTADDLLPRNDWEGAWAAWVTASCLLPRDPAHLAPDEDCTCGFYALNSSEDVAEFSEAIVFQSAASRAEGSEGAVLGRVLLAGKVIEHETGYRAERARIAELIPTTTDAGTTLALASRLGLPVGPTLDTAPLLLEMEEFFGQDSSERLWRPGLVDRWRLRRHSRHFRLIQGTRDD